MITQPIQSLLRRAQIAVPAVVLAGALVASAISGTMTTPADALKQSVPTRYLDASLGRSHRDSQRTLDGSSASSASAPADQPTASRTATTGLADIDNERVTKW